MGILEEVVGLIRHLGDAIENLTRGLERSVRRSYEMFDYVSARRAKIALTKLHKYGTEFGVMQSPVPERFLWYSNDPSPERWEEVKADLAKVLAAIPEIAAEASKADSAFVLEPAYKDYLIAMKSRRDLIGKLLASPPPSTPEELAALSQVRTDYLRLMDMLEQCQGRLSAYIKSKFPGQKHDLTLDELPDARPDERSIWHADPGKR